MKNGLDVIKKHFCKPTQALECGVQFLLQQQQQQQQQPFANFRSYFFFANYLTFWTQQGSSLSINRLTVGCATIIKELTYYLWTYLESSGGSWSCIVVVLFADETWRQKAHFFRDSPLQNLHQLTAFFEGVLRLLSSWWCQKGLSQHQLNVIMFMSFWSF